MILTVDIGNTTVCVCGVENLGLGGHAAIFFTYMK